MPPGLRAGDRIRVIAPCGAFDRDAFLAGVRVLEAAGFKPRFDEGVFARDRYLAGADSRRLAELQAALHDDEARVLWIARGGYGATRLLPQLDPAQVAAAGKWLVGFSDATALHALWRRAKVGSVHGANMTTLARWSAAARQALWDILTAGKMPRVAGRGVQGKAAVRGELGGGNLTVLAAMAGTGQLPSFAGAVVLLEDVGERPYRLDRSLTQLVQAGAFAGVKGFAIGQLSGCDDPEQGYLGLDVVLGVLSPLGLPIVCELPIGHADSSLPASLGSPVLLDAAAGTLGPA